MLLAHCNKGTEEINNKKQPSLIPYHSAEVKSLFLAEMHRKTGRFPCERVSVFLDKYRSFCLEFASKFLHLDLTFLHNCYH